MYFSTLLYVISHTLSSAFTVFFALTVVPNHTAKLKSVFFRLTPTLFNETQLERERRKIGKKFYDLIPKPYHFRLFILFDRLQRGDGDRTRTLCGNLSPKAVINYILLNIFPRRDSAGKNGSHFRFALQLRSERHGKLTERFFSRAVNRKIRHRANTRHTADRKNFELTVEISSL